MDVYGGESIDNKVFYMWADTLDINYDNIKTVRVVDDWDTLKCHNYAWGIKYLLFFFLIKLSKIVLLIN